MTEMDCVELQSICTLITKGTTPTTLGRRFVERGINFIKSESIGYDGSIEASTFAHIDEATHAALKRSQIAENDLLYSIAGVHLGKCASARRGHLPANTNQAVAIIRIDAARAVSKFVEYVLRNRPFVTAVNAGVAQSAQPNINLAEIGRFKIPLPPMDEQRAIARALGSLDDKIGLNRQMNETLEAIARAIFKSWFVDFDLVRAKAQGRAAHRISNEWKLFPDKLDGDGKPEGWKVSEIRSLANSIQYGLTTSARSQGPGPQFLRITDIQGGFVSWESVPFCDASKEEEESYRLASGDIVVARTGASTGENAYIIEPPRAVFASYLVRFQFSDPGLARVVAQHMRSAEYQSFIERAIGGSAQPNASAQLLGSAPIIVPSQPVARAFLDIVSPMDAMKRNNERENAALAAIRDALLPKLISGEIQIKNAEKAVETGAESLAISK